MSAPDFKTGDFVRIRPEWGGEREPVHVVVEWNGDRGVIAPAEWNHGTIRPIELVRAEMIEPAFPRPVLRKSRSYEARSNRKKGQTMPDMNEIPVGDEQLPGNARTPSFFEDLETLRRKWPMVYVEAWTPDDFDDAVSMVSGEGEAVPADWGDPKHLETARLLDKRFDAEAGTFWERVADCAGEGGR